MIQSRGYVIQMSCTYTDEMHLLYNRDALIQSRCTPYTVEMHLYSRDVLIQSIQSRCTYTVEMHLPFSPDPLKKLLNGPYVSRSLCQHGKTYNGFSVGSSPEENEELKHLFATVVNQHTWLTGARKTSHKQNSKDLSRLR